jgi:hypothetical protein
MDIREWLQERCRSATSKRTAVADLLRDYRAWCARAGDRPMRRGDFLDELRRETHCVTHDDGKPLLCDGGKQAVLGVVLQSAVEHVPRPRGRPKGIPGKKGPRGPIQRAHWPARLGPQENAGDVEAWAAQRVRMTVWHDELVADMWADYVAWCCEEGAEAWPVRQFAVILRAMGMATFIDRGKAWVRKVKLVAAPAVDGGAL